MIVNTILNEWPKETIYNNLKNDFKDLKALEDMLKEIEFNLLCSRAMEDVERTLADQESYVE